MQVVPIPGWAVAGGTSWKPTVPGLGFGRFVESPVGHRWGNRRAPSELTFEERSDLRQRPRALKSFTACSRSAALVIGVGNG